MNRVEMQIPNQCERDRSIYSKISDINFEKMTSFYIKDIYYIPYMSILYQYM